MIKFLVTTNDCSDFALANILSTVHTIVQMICIIVPVILILSVIISLVGFLINPDAKNKGSNIIHKILAAIIVFLLPTIVDTTMALLSYAGTNNDSFQVAACWTLGAEKAKGLNTEVTDDTTKTENNTEN